MARMNENGENTSPIVLTIVVPPGEGVGRVAFSLLGLPDPTIEDTREVLRLALQRVHELELSAIYNKAYRKGLEESQRHQGQQQVYSEALEESE